MAPARFAYFRTHHRRAGSSPSTPQSGQWQNSSPLNESATSPTSSEDRSPSKASLVSPLPPKLPPIRRVASVQENNDVDLEDIFSKMSVENTSSGSGKKSIPAPSQPLLRVQLRARVDSQDTYLDHVVPAKANTRANPCDTACEGLPVAIVQIDRDESRAVQKDSQDTTRNSSSETTTAAGSLCSTDSRDYMQSVPLDMSSRSSKDIVQTPITPLSRHSYTESHRPTLPAINDQYSSFPPSFSSFQNAASSSNPTSDLSPSSSQPYQTPTSTTPKLSKAKLNLLHPMSMLMRRRTFQSSDSLSEELLLAPKALAVNVMDLPENYDPRIKGKGIHDFSAPRPRRNFSTDDIGGTLATGINHSSVVKNDNLQSTVPLHPSKLEAAEVVPLATRRTPEKEHTPVFVEHFEDEGHDRHDHSAVHRESLANASFLARMSKQLTSDSLEPSSYINISSSEPHPPTLKHEQRESRSTVAPSFRDSRESIDRGTVRSSVTNDTQATSPSRSPPLENASTLLLDPSAQALGLPKHLSSSASHSSRFSFQLGSDRSKAEEQALEERHKQKVAAVNTGLRSVDSEEEDDYSNYDDIDDGGYDEEIPYINADTDGGQVLEAQAVPISRAVSATCSIESRCKSRPPSLVQAKEGQRSSVQGLGLLPPPDFGIREPHITPRDSQPNRKDTQHSVRSDDMYFDDGIIAEPGQSETHEFDESVFDAPTQSYYDQPPNTEAIQTVPVDPHHPAFNYQSGADTDSDSDSSYSDDNDNYHEVRTDAYSLMNPVEAQYLSPLLNIELPQSNPSENLDAYHNALASAASKAAEEGKFTWHQTSHETNTSSQIQAPRSHIQDMREAAPNSANEIAPPKYHANGNDIADDDNDWEDDLMVAAANAEALAADESGFYGREFGFYGKSNANSTESFHGGFFGSPDPHSLGRSKSGQEPNLTPISERSEFSTRNSFVSLHGTFGSGLPNLTVTRDREGNMQLPSSGLKDIAATISSNDEDFMLTQLTKLRQQVFGGSSVSNSSNPSIAIVRSPLTLKTAKLATSESSNSPLGELGEDEEEDSASSSQSSPTVTMPIKTVTAADVLKHMASPELNKMSTDKSYKDPDSISNTSTPPRGQTRDFLPAPNYNTYIPSTHSPPPTTAALPMPSTSQLRRFAVRPPAPSSSYAQWYHQQQSPQEPSYSDSVAYVAEEIAVAGEDSDSAVQDDAASYLGRADFGSERTRTKWYLEKRRTMSTGEVVVLGREEVVGGRI